MACSHRELWFCPVGWKFTKPGAGLWWTLFLVLPFLCPLRCKVTSAHQREAPYRVHLMLLTPKHTLTLPASPYAHIHLSAHTLYIWKKLKMNHPSHLFGYLLVSLPSVCPFAVGSGSPGDFPHLLWCEMKGEVWICCSKTLRVTIQVPNTAYDREKDATTQRCVCAPGQRWAWMSLVSLAFSRQAWPVESLSLQVNHLAISVSEAPCSPDDSPADWPNWTPVWGTITLHCFLYGT